MDNLLAVHQKKVTKHPLKTNKKPLKVVYISNPMKVKTSASKFRALVQELTGRDSDMPRPESQEASKFSGTAGRESKLLVAEEEEEEEDQQKEEEHAVVEEEEPTASADQSRIGSDLLSSYEDDVFMPQMPENFPGFLPSNFWYESTHIDVIKG